MFIISLSSPFAFLSFRFCVCYVLRVAAPLFASAPRRAPCPGGLLGVYWRSLAVALSLSRLRSSVRSSSSLVHRAYRRCSLRYEQLQQTTTAAAATTVVITPAAATIAAVATAAYTTDNYDYSRSSSCSNDYSHSNSNSRDSGGSSDKIAHMPIEATASQADVY